MTPDEIISTIKRSFIPTICVEGVQDKSALRLIDRLIGVNGSVLCCNGRKNLFAIWERRYEFSDKKVAFLADRDLYLFEKIPSKYNGIIFTYGYSLENDIILTEKWKDILTSEDYSVLNLAIDMSLNHYWCECKKFVESKQQPVWISAHRLLKDHNDGLYTANIGFDSCPIYRKISKKPFRFLRGKNLLECIHAALSYKQRQNKFSPGHIIEISVRPNEGKYLKKILAGIKNEICTPITDAGNSTLC